MSHLNPSNLPNTPRPANTPRLASPRSTALALLAVLTLGCQPSTPGGSTPGGSTPGGSTPGGSTPASGAGAIAGAPASGNSPLATRTGAQDEAAARSLFEEAVRAELDGDAWLAEERFLALAAQHPGTPHGLTARHRLTSGGGPLMLLALTGGAAAVAIPAFQKYIARSKSAEALMNTRQIADGVVSDWMEQPTTAPDGSPQPRRFPPAVGPTPAASACIDGESVPHAPNPQLWQHPTWQRLGFAPAGPLRYQYSVEPTSDDDAAVFVVRAVGDLNCNGVFSTFERAVRVDAAGELTLEARTPVNETE